MDTNTILTILGIAVAVIIPIWLALRRRYPGQITYFEENCLGLFDSIVRNIGDLKVLYKDEPVGENLVLLKGYIMNTGSKDITPAMIEEPLALKLPEGFRWLDAKVVSSRPVVKASLQIKESTSAEFNLGLFRVNEYVKFEALVQVPAVDLQREVGVNKSAVAKLRNALTVVHRIADSQKAIKGRVPSREPLRTFLLEFGLALFFGLFFLGAGVFALVRGGGTNKELHFLVETKDGDTIETKIDLAREGTLIVKDVHSSVTQSQSPAEFFAGCPFTPKVAEKANLPPLAFTLIRAASVIIGILFLGGAISGYQEYNKARRIRSLLSLE